MSVVGISNQLIAFFMFFVVCGCYVEYIQVNLLKAFAQKWNGQAGRGQDIFEWHGDLRWKGGGLYHNPENASRRASE